MPAGAPARRIRLREACATARSSQEGAKALLGVTYMSMWSRTAILAAAAAAVVITILTGTPRKLPDVALSSPVLLHLERVLTFLGACVVVLVLLVRAWNGQLPIEMSMQGVKYRADPATEASDRLLSELVEDSRERKADVADLLRRVEALEGRD
jgi:hypothetical protein